MPEDKTTRSNEVPNQNPDALEHFSQPKTPEKAKTPLEEMLWDPKIAKQVEEILQTYDHTPAYRMQFLAYLKKNDDVRDDLVAKLHALENDQQAIQETVVEYLVQSCPELKMNEWLEAQEEYPKKMNLLEEKQNTDDIIRQKTAENQQKTAIKEEQEFLKTVKEKGVWRIKDNDLAMQNAKDMIEIYKKRWYVLQTLEARKAFVDLGLSVEGLQTKK